MKALVSVDRFGILQSQGSVPRSSAPPHADRAREQHDVKRALEGHVLKQAVVLPELCAHPQCYFTRDGRRR